MNRALLLGLLLVLPTLPLTPAQATPATSFGDELYDPNFLGWTYYGFPKPTYDTANAWSGASMALTMSGSLQAERTYTRSIFGGVSLSSAPVFEFAWNGGDPHGSGANVDSWVTWTFGGGASVEFQPTALGQNDQALLRVFTAAGGLQSSGIYRTPSGLPWTWSPNTWYRTVATHDLSARTVTSSVYDQSGALIATSDAASLPSGISTFDEYRITVSNPATGTNTFHYDSFYVHALGVPNRPEAIGIQAGPQVGQLRVTWSAPTGTVAPTSYRIYRGTAADAPTLLTTLASTETSFTDTNLSEGARWYYRLSAVNAAGEGPFSASKDATTWARPAAPGSLTATQGPGVGQIRLAWSAPNNGGTSITSYRIYRGAAAGNETLLTEIAPATSWTDSTLPNGTRFFYKLSAVNAVGEGAQSSGLNQLPKPDSVTGPTGLTVTPSRVWTGDAMTVNFTYTVTATQCPTSETCPVTNEWRVLLDGATGTTSGTLLASGTNTHAGHAQPETYTVSATVNPSAADGAHALRAIVTARSGNNLWQDATQAVTVDTVLPAQLTGPSWALLSPTTIWGGETVRVQTDYSVFQKQCRTTASCPITNEWQVVLDGTTLITSGSNAHPAHGETQSYHVDVNWTTPTLPPGAHTLTVSVREDPGSMWRNETSLFRVRNATTSTLPIPDTVCRSEPDYFTYLAPRTSATNITGRGFPKSFSYITNGTISPFRATFYDGCDSPLYSNGDGTYEYGHGGILLNRSRFASNATFQIFDASGNVAPVLVGSDQDGTGVIGDTPFDCLRGPYELEASIQCPADPDGNVVFFIKQSPSIAPGIDPHDLFWGRIRYCEPVKHYCTPEVQIHGIFFIESQEDNDNDGLGDNWENKAAEEAHYAEGVVDKLQDQEFATACAPPCTNIQRNGDGLQNFVEFRWLTIPIGPLRFAGVTVLANARDSDTDNWEDGPEVGYWNDARNDPTLDDPGTWTAIDAAPIDPDRKYDPDNDKKGVVDDPDSDNDGLLDGDEYNTWKTFPELKDSDCADNETACDGPKPNRFDAKLGVHNGGDHINDSAEKAYWTATGRSVWRNLDGDAIKNNLLDPDSDGDHILDGDEINCATPCLPQDQSKADDPDSDNDGLLDGTDQQLLSSDSRTSIYLSQGIAYAITTGGYYYFYGEDRAAVGTLDTFRNMTDSDGDCLPDGWEVLYGLDPRNPADANSTAADGDNMTALEEYNYGRAALTCDLALRWSGLDPTQADTDLDDLWDGEEYGVGSDPREPDTDLDGLQDGLEYHQYGTSPTLRDSDGDRLSDYQEIVTYRNRNVSATNPNSDNCCNTTNNDTLTDYQEIIQYGTKTDQTDANLDGRPDGWDSDNDGVADGWDTSPLRYDSPPQRTTTPPVLPAPGPEDAYVVIRDHYVDVMVRDAHGSESNIGAVDIRVNFTGTIEGSSKTWVLVQHDAYRFDDGQTWGARIPLPRNMTGSGTQTFSLTVAGTDGSLRAYYKNFTNAMSRVGWNDETDPDPTTQWQNFAVHPSMGETPAGSGSGASAPSGGDAPSPDSPGVGGGELPLDPYNMTVDQLFATYGQFSVYRLKPFAYVQSDLPGVLNASAFSVLEDLSVTLGLNETESALRNASNTTWNITLYTDAFEYVDPLQEPWVYASMSTGGNGYFRAPKWLRVGVEKSWKYTANGAGFIYDQAVAEGASFVFGSDDPRAKGHVAGDIVAGILVYGDARDIVLGVAQDQPWKTVLGGVGIALTWVGPGADGPYSAFKAGAKLIASVPVAGPRVVIKMATDIRDQAKAFRALKETGFGEAAGQALRFVANEGDVALWASRNTDKVVDFERVKNALPPTTVHALKDNLDIVTPLAADLALATSDQEATTILKRFSQPGVADGILPAGGADSIRQLAEVTEAVREAAKESQKDPAIVGTLVKNLDTVRNAQNGAAWWSSRLKPNLLTNTKGRWGYVFEPEIAARLAGRNELGAVDGELRDVRLWDANKQPTGDPIPSVQIDMFSVLNGKKVVTEVKSGAGTAISSSQDLRTQMERHAAAVAKYRTDPDANLANEIHWYFEKPPTQGVKDWAMSMADKYGVVIKLKDPSGADYLTYV